MSKVNYLVLIMCHILLMGFNSYAEVSCDNNEAQQRVNELQGLATEIEEDMKKNQREMEFKTNEINRKIDELNSSVNQGHAESVGNEIASLKNELESINEAERIRESLKWCGLTEQVRPYLYECRWDSAVSTCEPLNGNYRTHSPSGVGEFGKGNKEGLVNVWKTYGEARKGEEKTVKEVGESIKNCSAATAAVSKSSACQTDPFAPFQNKEHIMKTCTVARVQSLIKNISEKTLEDSIKICKTVKSEFKGRQTRRNAYNRVQDYGKRMNETKKSIDRLTASEKPKIGP